MAPRQQNMDEEVKKKQPKTEQPQHLKFARGARSYKLQIQKFAVSQSQKRFDALVGAIETLHPLKHGMKVDRNLRKRQFAREGDPEPKKLRIHGQAYTLAGVIKAAFKNIGKSVTPRRGVDGSGHILSMISATAGIGVEMEIIAVNNFVEESLRNPNCLGFWVGRWHDATPIHLAFGRLEAELVPFCAVFASQR